MLWMIIIFLFIVSYSNNFLRHMNFDDFFFHLYFISFFLRTLINLYDGNRNFMWPIYSFVWAIRHVRACGVWKNHRIMEKHGPHGNTSPTQPPIVRHSLASNQRKPSLEMTMSSAQRNIRRLCRWKTVKYPLFCWTIGHRKTTISIRRCYRNGHVPRTFASGFCAQKRCWAIWCQSLDKIQRLRVV